MSPTVEFSCATAIASLSVGRLLMARPLPPRRAVPQWAALQGCPDLADRRHRQTPGWNAPAFARTLGTCLFRRRAQPRPAAAERYRAHRFQIASVELKRLKVLLDH